MIIGLCGTSLPGRSELAKILIDNKYAYYSIQNEIAEDMGSSAIQDPVAKVAWDLRVCKKEGNAVWVKRILAKVSSTNVVIEGIRHEEEIALLKKQGKCILIGVYAPAEIKFKRALAQDVMEKRLSGKEDIEEEDEVDEFKVLKYIDYSIPYPAKNMEGQIVAILKKELKVGK